MLRIPACVVALAFVPAAVSAQTLYGIDSPGATSVVTEFTGPPFGPCAYPDGPVLNAFPTLIPFLCPPVGPIAPPVLGDVAFDRMTDTVWATDGTAISNYTTTGTILNTFTTSLLGPLTGLGFDAGAGVLWLTDGSDIAAVIPPPPPGCGAAPTIVCPPFPAPVSSLVTDVDWDPKTDTLWICDSFGHVTNVVPCSGVLGPFGSFSVFGVCGLGVPLTGITYDPGTPKWTGGPPAFFVTDGTRIAYLSPPGGPAPTKLPTPLNCFLSPTSSPIAGLASSSHGVNFGTSTGLRQVKIVSSGNTTIPGVFKVKLTNANPGSFCFIKIDFPSPACFGPCPPAFILQGKNVYCSCPGGLFLGQGVVPFSGEIELGFTIPAVIYCGQEICMQWLVKEVPTGLSFSNGLWLTLGLK